MTALRLIDVEKCQATCVVNTGTPADKRQPHNHVVAFFRIL